jgi:hypothetical protein
MGAVAWGQRATSGGSEHYAGEPIFGDIRVDSDERPEVRNAVLLPARS